MRRPSPATAIAFVALMVALGGVAWAQTQLAPDSVGRIHIREGSVGSAQVRDHSLRRKDFAPKQIPRGPRGRRGRPGATNVAKVNQSGPEVVPGQIGEVSVDCPQGSRLTGGGGGFAGPPTTNDRLVESIPVGDGPPQRWRITLYNGGERPRTPVAYAICAAP